MQYFLNATTFALYYAATNAAGDVLGLYTGNGNQVVWYEYDAWGNATITDTTGLKIGTVNPIRYRGYYYDAETDFYYVQSRYYDPVVGWGAAALIAKYGVTTAATSITKGEDARVSSFNALKRSLGSAGRGKQWHHIVEQCQIGKSGRSIGFKTLIMLLISVILFMPKLVHIIVAFKVLQTA